MLKEKLIFIYVNIALVSVLILGTNFSNIAFGAYDNIFTNQDSPHGIAYGEWIAKWWTWWLAIPNEVHPHNDLADVNRCATEQGDDLVWFLPDVQFPNVHKDVVCKIPLGKDILLPISTTIASPFEGSDKDLVKRSENIYTFDPIKNGAYKQITVFVDDTKIENDYIKNMLYGKTDFFNVTLPDTPLSLLELKVKGGSWKSIATGYFLFLQNLTRGEHIIDMHIEERLAGNEQVNEPIQTRDFTYKISVQ